MGRVLHWLGLRVQRRAWCARMADCKRDRYIPSPAGATIMAGSVVGTLVAGAILGAYANLVGAHPERPPRLVLLLVGFFVLTVGGLGGRGVTALIAGDA